jgi:uncharacterized protein (TIGR03435 family)
MLELMHPAERFRYIRVVDTSFHRRLSFCQNLSVGSFKNLEWSAENQDGALSANTVTQSPSISTAIRDQLGLQLKSENVTVDIVVVDHIDKTPSSN